MRQAIIGTIAGVASAWWDKGHLIVARRAYDILEAENPTALAGANSELAVLKADSSIPALSDEKNYPFVECAPFADNIKGQGYSFQAEWHFVNDPYLDEDQNIDDYNFNDYNSQNVTEAILDINDWLLNTGNYKSSTTYIDIMKYFTSEADGRSFALRLLIHYVGDSHQPCHSITRVDDDYPTGDRGCNSLYLPSKDGAGNLHAVWDSVEYEMGGYATLPLSSGDWSELGQQATRIGDAHPIKSSEYHNADPWYWADENMEYAQAVYGGVDKNVPLSDGYVSNNKSLAEKRLSWGGRRLANMIMAIYGDNALFLQ